MFTSSAEQPSRWQRSTTRRFLKWLFSWRTVRRTLIGLVTLVTLIALVFAEENWRGKRAWKQSKRLLEVRGEPLTLLAFAQPPVPDDQNFAMTPLLRPLFPRKTDYGDQLRKRLDLAAARKGEPMPSLGSWPTGQAIDFNEWREYLGTTNLLQFLQRFDSELDEITAASRRPYTRFPLRYEDGFAMLLPHLHTLRQLARLYALRACAALANGQPDRAATDLQTIFRLADCLEHEPLLVSQLVRVAIAQRGLQVAWEGLGRHQWSDDQLAAFQDDLRRMDFLAGGVRALQGERAALIDTLEPLIGRRRDLQNYAAGLENDTPLLSLSVVPRGWLYQNLVSACRFYDEHFFSAVDLTERRVHPRTIDSSESRLSAMPRTPYTVLVKLFVPALSACQLRFAATQTAVDAATVACALERYRLVHGQLPEQLDDLAPRFLDPLPHDIITGEPFRYRRTAGDQVLLYSVGWNETDDDGAVVLTNAKRPRQDLKRGDWVWPNPPGHESFP
ncbi:hypothetical protein HQ590_04075 [bacterium]|nr:hypothetical protein [bacterium]